MKLPTLAVEVTCYITVPADVYSSADFDNNVQEYVNWVAKEAAEGIRHVEFDIGATDVKVEQE